jgi:molybdopterin-guanine dinucleotide biosynthesis protein
MVHAGSPATSFLFQSFSNVSRSKFGLLPDLVVQIRHLFLHPAAQLLPAFRSRRDREHVNSKSAAGTMSCPVNEHLLEVGLFVAGAALYRHIQKKIQPTPAAVPPVEQTRVDRAHSHQVQSIGSIAAESEIYLPGSPGNTRKGLSMSPPGNMSPPATPEASRKTVVGDDTSFHFLTPVSSSICLAEPLIHKIDQSSSNQIIVIGIAGGSGSGKTTLARAIYESIGEDNITFLSHDSYYRDLGHLEEAERARQNFDHPDSLETSLLVTHIRALKRRQRVAVPTYDYTTHTRVAGTMVLSARSVVLVEGILIFSHKEVCITIIDTIIHNNRHNYTAYKH